jgi:hypothetical protein
MSDTNTQTSNPRESYDLEVVPSPEQAKPISKRVFSAIGYVASKITKPTINRINNTSEFFEALPSRSSTPEQIAHFEQKYIHPPEIKHDTVGNVQSPPNDPLPASDVA